MSIKFIILGCGSSMGVPRPDGFFGNCDPKNKKNYRTRCSALIKTTDENILIDTSPDLRQQLLRHKIKKIDKVFYSHMHADQTHGINDLRSFFINSRKQLEVYADKATSKYLKHNFSYCFESLSKEYPATLKLNELKKNYNILFEKYLYLFDNDNANSAIQDLLLQQHNYVNEFKEILDLYYTTRENKYLKNALNYYITNIINIDEKILNNQYKYNAIEKDLDNNMNYLIQNKYLQTDIELLVND